MSYIYSTNDLVLLRLIQIPESQGISLEGPLLQISPNPLTTAAFHVENLTRILDLITQSVYLGFYYSDNYDYSDFVFFQILANFSWFIILRTAVFEISLIFTHFWALFEQFSGVCLFFDVVGEFFRLIMLFLMTLHRLNVFLEIRKVEWVFRKSRIIILVSLCVIISAIAAVVLIQTSEMRRLYIRSVGFVDSGIPGYQMLINRLFYIFPFGSIICYVVLYFHIRRMAQQVISRRTAQSGEQRVFIQLFITILFYGVMCAVFEYINTKDWSHDASEKLNMVAVLNIVNYLPEISLPLMLLISNTDMRRRISTMVGPRITRSATVSVVAPVPG